LALADDSPCIWTQHLPVAAVFETLPASINSCGKFDYFYKMDMMEINMSPLKAPEEGTG